MQIVDLMVEIEGSGVAAPALAFPKKHLFSPTLTWTRLSSVQAAGDRIELRRGRKVEHVLELRHVAHTNAIKNNHSLFCRMNRVAIEIRCALLKFGKVFY